MDKDTPCREPSRNCPHLARRASETGGKWVLKQSPGTQEEYSGKRGGSYARQSVDSFGGGDGLATVATAARVGGCIAAGRSISVWGRRGGGLSGLCQGLLFLAATFRAWIGPGYQFLRLATGGSPGDAAGGVDDRTDGLAAHVHDSRRHRICLGTLLVRLVPR